MKITKRQLRRIIKEVLDQSDSLFYIDKSPIHGIGVFASREIPQYSDLGIAHIFKDGEWWNNIDEEPMLSQYYNHSKNPSCFEKNIDKEKHIITSKDLRKGDEITVDYNLLPALGLEDAEPGWK